MWMSYAIFLQSITNSEFTQPKTFAEIKTATYFFGNSKEITPLEKQNSFHKLGIYGVFHWKHFPGEC